MLVGSTIREGFGHSVKRHESEVAAISPHECTGGFSGPFLGVDELQELVSIHLSEDGGTDSDAQDTGEVLG